MFMSMCVFVFFCLLVSVRNGVRSMHLRVPTNSFQLNSIGRDTTATAAPINNIAFNFIVMHARTQQIDIALHKSRVSFASHDRASLAIIACFITEKKNSPKKTKQNTDFAIKNTDVDWISAAQLFLMNFSLAFSLRCVGQRDVSDVVTRRAIIAFL